MWRPQARSRRARRRRRAALDRDADQFPFQFTFSGSFPLTLASKLSRSFPLKRGLPFKSVIFHLAPKMHYNFSQKTPKHP